jgi:hypothetical protein
VPSAKIPEPLSKACQHLLLTALRMRQADQGGPGFAMRARLATYALHTVAFLVFLAGCALLEQLSMSVPSASLAGV